MQGEAKRGANVSGNLDELHERMLARRKKFRLRSKAVSGLVLAAIISGITFAAVLLWHQVGPSGPVAGHAASSVQAD